MYQRQQAGSREASRCSPAIHCLPSGDVLRDRYLRNFAAREHQAKRQIQSTPATRVAFDFTFHIAAKVGSLPTPALTHEGAGKRAGGAPSAGTASSSGGGAASAAAASATEGRGVKRELDPNEPAKAILI